MIATLSLVFSASTAFVPSATPLGARAVARSSAVEMLNVKDIPNKMIWTDFVQAKACPPGEIVSGFRYGQEIAIVNDKGSLYACSNKLPPTGQPATFAEIEGKGVIVEPVSGTRFNLKTGKPVGKWCPSLVGTIIKLLVSETDVPVFPVRKSGNAIQVLINVNAKAQFEASYWRGILDSQGKVDGGYY